MSAMDLIRFRMRPISRRGPSWRPMHTQPLCQQYERVAGAVAEDHRGICLPKFQFAGNRGTGVCHRPHPGSPSDTSKNARGENRRSSCAATPCAAQAGIVPMFDRKNGLFSGCFRRNRGSARKKRALVTRIFTICWDSYDCKPLIMSNIRRPGPSKKIAPKTLPWVFCPFPDVLEWSHKCRNDISG